MLLITLGLKHETEKPTEIYYAQVNNSTAQFTDFAETLDCIDLGGFHTNSQ